jgi:hypothetical protein
MSGLAVSTTPVVVTAATEAEVAVATCSAVTAASAPAPLASVRASAFAAARPGAGGATTFRFPQHQSPQRLAYMFGVDPHVSLKVDGVFAANTLRGTIDQYSFDPPLPSSWELVEGELYHPDLDSQLLPIVYVFLVQSRDRSMLTLADMNAELITQYATAMAVRRTEAASIASTQTSLQATLAATGRTQEDIRRHMALSLATRDQMLTESSSSATAAASARPRATWFPKLYFPLDTANWNGYMRHD